MIQEKVSLIIFEGGQSVTPIEVQMTAIRKSVALDTIEKMSAIPDIDEIILCTNYPDLAQQASTFGVEVDFDDDLDAFHFGERLKNVINSRGLENVIYMGGVSAPLITPEEVTAIARDLRERKNVVVVNNVQSADLIAWTPGSAINHIELPSADNILGFRLRRAGLSRILIPNSPRINFDIDTPTDILLLGMQPDVGPRAADEIARLGWDDSNIRAAKEVFGTADSHVTLIGRVGPPIMQFISMNLITHLRVYSEERGMKALGREESEEAISLVGQFIDSVGPYEFFRALGRLSQAVFFDTRVVFAHKKLHPTEWDRFNSDLGRYDLIKDPFIRDFTVAATKAGYPIVLGGHSLIYGGIWLLAEELAQARRQSVSTPYY